MEEVTKLLKIFLLATGIVMVVGNINLAAEGHNSFSQTDGVNAWLQQRSAFPRQSELSGEPDAWLNQRADFVRQATEWKPSLRNVSVEASSFNSRTENLGVDKIVPGVRRRYYQEHQTQAGEF